jgi:hypothetical protein
MSKKNTPNEKHWTYSFTLAKKLEEQKEINKQLQYDNGQVGLKLLVTTRKESKI